MDALGRALEVGDMVYTRTTDTFADLEKHLANVRSYDYLLRGRTKPVPVLEKLGYAIRTPWRSGTKDHNTHLIIKDDGLVYDSEFEIITVGAKVVFSNVYSDIKTCNIMTGTVIDTLGTAVKIELDSNKSFPKMRVPKWQPAMLVRVIG